MALCPEVLATPVAARFRSLNYRFWALSVSSNPLLKAPAPLPIKRSFAMASRTFTLALCSGFSAHSTESSPRPDGFPGKGIQRRSGNARIKMNTVSQRPEFYELHNGSKSPLPFSVTEYERRLTALGN